MAGQLYADWWARMSNINMAKCQLFFDLSEIRHEENFVHFEHPLAEKKIRLNKFDNKIFKKFNKSLLIK